MRRLLLLATALTLIAPPAAAQLPGQAAGGLSSANVEYFGRIPDAGAFGARISGDTMYVTTVAGLRIYDLSLLDGFPVLVGAIGIPHFGNEDVDTNGEILLISTDSGLGSPSLLYVIDVSNPHIPAVLSVHQFNGPRAHTASCILDCDYAWVAGSNSVTVMDLRDPTNPVQAGRFFIDGSSNPDGGGFGTSHDVNVDESGLAWISSTAGLYAYDPSNPVNPALVAGRGNDGTPKAFDNQFIIHNSERPNAASTTPAKLADNVVDPGELLLVTEEDWISATNGLCSEDGAFQTGWYHTVGGVPVIERLDHVNVGNLNLDGSQKPLPLGTCSSHYFSFRDDGVAAVSWYEQGVRFFDVSDPRDIRPIGYFLPADANTLATKFHNGFLYTFDLARGIDVLKFNGAPGSSTVKMPPLQPVTPDVRPDPTFGYACRVA